MPRYIVRADSHLPDWFIAYDTQVNWPVLFNYGRTRVIVEKQVADLNREYEAWMASKETAQ